MDSPRFVTSLKAVESTIKIDPHTSRWFLFLVTQPFVYDRLKNDPRVVSLLRKLKWISKGEALLYVPVGVILIMMIENKYYLLPMALVCLYGLWRCHAAKKRIVVSISMSLLARDFPGDEIRTKTIYQISEFYARKYNIPSLVDTIASSQRILQIAVLMCVPVVFFMQALNLLGIVTLFLTVYGVVCIILNTNFVYRGLR